MPDVIVAPRLDDKTALELFRRIALQSEPSHCSVSLAGQGAFDLFTANEEGRRLCSKVDSATSFTVVRIDASFPGLSLTYFRGGEPNSERRQSAVLDEIKINRSQPPPNQSRLSDEVVVDIIQVIHATIGIPATAGWLPSGGGASRDELDALYQSTVLRLETAFAEQIQKITTWTIEQANHLKEEKLRLAQETNIERELNRVEYEKKLVDLQSHSDELEERRKALDDRDYMHARRATYGELKNRTAEREKEFALTQGTKRMRAPLHAVFVILILVLASLNVGNFWQVSRLDFATAPIFAVVWGLIKQAILGLGLIGAILYYVRWMNKWFEEHAEAEFLVKQFQLDVDRASWAVETAFEWHRLQQSELPTPLLEGITRNLFAQAKQEKRETSAADELASALIGSAASAKLKIGDSELTLNRKGLRELARSEATRETP